MAVKSETNYFFYLAQNNSEGDTSVTSQNQSKES
jgi:hypothetical protein